MLEWAEKKQVIFSDTGLCTRGNGI